MVCGWERLSVQRGLHWRQLRPARTFLPPCCNAGDSVSEPLALNAPNSFVLRSVRLIFPLLSDEHGEEKIDATFENPHY